MRLLILLSAVTFAGCMGPGPGGSTLQRAVLWGYDNSSLCFDRASVAAFGSRIKSDSVVTERDYSVDIDDVRLKGSNVGGKFEIGMSLTGLPCERLRTLLGN